MLSRILKIITVEKKAYCEGPANWIGGGARFPARMPQTIPVGHIELYVKVPAWSMNAEGSIPLQINSLPACPPASLRHGTRELLQLSSSFPLRETTEVIRVIMRMTPRGCYIYVIMRLHYFHNGEPIMRFDSRCKAH